MGSSAFNQFVALMTGLRNVATRHRDTGLAAAAQCCIGRVSAGTPDCPLGAFFVGPAAEPGRWTAPPPTPGKMPFVPNAPAQFDGVKALNFVHKTLADKALMTGDSRYLAALRACRWHRNTTDACPMYRDYLRDAPPPSGNRPSSGR